MTWRLLLRQFRAGLGSAVALALIVAVAAAAFTAWPRLERATFSDELSYRVETTPPTVRALSSTTAGVPVGSPGRWDQWQAAIEERIAQAGEGLAATTGSPHTWVTSEAAPMRTPGGPPEEFYAISARLRADPGVGDQVQITQGQAPAPVPWPDAPQGRAQAQAGGGLPPAQVMLSEATAERMGLEVGDRFTIPVQSGSLPFVVSGLFTARDTQAPQWQFQLHALQPRIDVDPNRGLSATMVAYLDPTNMAWLGTSTPLQPQTDVRVPVRADVTPQSDAHDAEALIAQLRTLTATGQPASAGGTITALDFSAPLVEVLSQTVTRWHSTTAVLAMVAAGPLGVTLVVLALASRVVLARRSRSLELIRARGGSPAQVRGLLALEGALWCVPAAVLGAALSVLLVPGPVQLTEMLMAGLIALTPPVVLAGSPEGRLRVGGRGTGLVRWRWPAELLLLGLTGVAVYLMLTRGVGTAATGVDPVAAGLPVLLALTVCALALRLLPLGLRAVHGWARRRPGLAVFLGSARAKDARGAAAAALFALVVGTSIAVFATTMIATLQHGTTSAARAEVGADISLTGDTFSAEDLDQLRQIEGVAALTGVASAPSVSLFQGDHQTWVTVYAVDSAAQGQVQTAVPGAVQLPAGFGQLQSGKLPVVVSSSQEVDAASAPFLSIEERVPVTVVDTQRYAPGLAQSKDWVVADASLLRELTGLNLPPDKVLIDVSEGAGAAAVAAQVRDWSDGRGQVRSPQEELARFTDSPAASSMQQGFIASLVLCVALAVLALVLAVILDGPARSRLLAVLRTLGLSRRGGHLLVVWEIAPIAVVALLVGAAEGLVLASLVAAGIDLRPFTGGAVQPPVVHDLPVLGAVLMTLVVVLAGCVLAATLTARRISATAENGDS